MYSLPLGMLTRAGFTVFNKTWDVAMPHKLVKLETTASFQTYSAKNWTVVFDFFCTRVLYYEEIEPKGLRAMKCSTVARQKKWALYLETADLVIYIAL